MHFPQTYIKKFHMEHRCKMRFYPLLTKHFLKFTIWSRSCSWRFRSFICYYWRVSCGCQTVIIEVPVITVEFSSTVIRGSFSSVKLWVSCNILDGSVRFMLTHVFTKITYHRAPDRKEHYSCYMEEEKSGFSLF